jgi:hypothetical protein
MQQKCQPHEQGLQQATGLKFMDFVENNVRCHGFIPEDRLKTPQNTYFLCTKVPTSLISGVTSYSSPK